MARDRRHRLVLELVPLRDDMLPLRDELPPAAIGTDAALCEAIGSWLRTQLSGDERLVERITDMAMAVRADGATVDETCLWTRNHVRSWLEHPANSPDSPSRPHLRLVRAS